MEPAFGVDEKWANATRETTYLIVNLTFASHSRLLSFFTNTIESWIAAPPKNTTCNQFATS
jgi:hypothetical protein